MSDIIINKDNLSRFNKRLQKTLEDFLGYKVNLNTASKIFAKVLGTNSEYELNKKINDDSKNLDLFFDEFEKARLKGMESIALSLQELLKETEAKFIFIDFYEHFSNNFIIGFNEFKKPNYQNSLEHDLFMHAINNNDSISESYSSIDKERMLKRTQRVLESSKLVNQSNVEKFQKILNFKNAVKEKIDCLLGHCYDGDYIAIEKNKISINIKNIDKTIITSPTQKQNIKAKSKFGI
jgi:hypothetical protein